MQTKMKRYKEKGFILLLVITILAVIGAVMFLLAEDSHTMLFESDTAYLRATQRNLTASALAWARYNMTNETSTILNKHDLDTANLTTRPATLSVTIETAENKEPQAQITTSTTRKRRTLKSKNKYTLAQ